MHAMQQEGKRHDRSMKLVIFHSLLCIDLFHTAFVRLPTNLFGMHKTGRTLRFVG
jgi:hypothetical protein